MHPYAFEIRVALLGHVSAGKSTVINALLRGKFAEAGMRRTTAGVNCFRLHAKEDASQQARPRKKSKTVVSIERKAASSPSSAAEEFHDAEYTYAKISKDNSALRESNQINESTFNVELDEPLCRMRPDTQLVLMDMPGLNEAGSKDLYLGHVEAQWTTFDCVIAVMDVFQGVNTEEQIQLLKLIESNLSSKKKMPVIVLCNKVDDFENEEIMMLVDEVQAKVNDIFDGKRKSSRINYATSFIPISAERAFVYRAASNLSLSEFKKLDKALIEKLGQDVVPKAKWRQLTQEARYLAAYEAVSCKATYEDNLKATNFQSFLDSFKSCLGGNETQRKLLLNQVEIARRSLSFDTIVARDIQKLCDINKMLGKVDTPYSDYFWNFYSTGSAKLIEAYKSDMDHGALQAAMTQLVEYGIFVKKLEGDEKEKSKVVEAMESLIRLQIGMIVKHSPSSTAPVVDRWYDWNDTLSCWRMEFPKCSQCSDGVVCPNTFHLYLHPTLAGATESNWHFTGHYWSENHTGMKSKYVGVQYKNRSKPPADCAHHWERLDEHKWRNRFTESVVESPDNPVLGKISWQGLSLCDACTISESILLLSSSTCFCDHFGREKISLERVLDRLKSFRDKHPLLEGTFDEYCDFVPKHPDKYRTVARIEMPRRLSDSAHWGHLVWQFCQYMDEK